MIPSLPRPAWLRAATVLSVGAFLVFLFLPLVIVGIFAFNDAPYPAPPWHGFTLDWFLGNEARGRTGLFQDRELIGSIGTSALVACWVTLLSVLLGTANAFLIERCRFPGKQALSLLMLAPLVIPGVILGISILAFASRLADLADDLWGLELDFLRPGLPLVVLGQFSYIATIATLTISARLKRFDRTLEEAALNLGASRAAVLGTIILPTSAIADRLRGDLVPDVVRGFQHDADAGRLRLAADGHDVRAHARGRDAGHERGQPVPDDRVGAARADATAPEQDRRLVVALREDLERDRLDLRRHARAAERLEARLAEPRAALRGRDERLARIELARELGK